MSKLFLVPTPIGNLEDITFRALRVLKEVDIVLVEDTRITKKLFNHYRFNKKQLLIIVSTSIRFMLKLLKR